MARGGTVLATGGWASDRAASSLLASHRPDLLSLATTNGPWATGDGVKLATSVGAAVVDMEQVQVHPTGFLDPAEPDASTKVCSGCCWGLTGIGKGDMRAACAACAVCRACLWCCGV